LPGLEGTYAVALTAPGYLQRLWDATERSRDARSSRIAVARVACRNHHARGSYGRDGDSVVSFRLRSRSTPRLDGDQRLWHQAHAAAGPDDAVAEGLDGVATRAHAQCAFAAAARALEHAARMTSDPDRRAERLLRAAERLLRAAESAHRAGHEHAALDHLRAALECVSAPPLRIELEHARGRITARSGEAARARTWLAATARSCEHDDPAKAAEILADAILPSLRAGSTADAVRLARRSMRLAQGAGHRVALIATVLLGTAVSFAGDYTEGAAHLDPADPLARARGPGHAEPVRREVLEQERPRGLVVLRNQDQPLLVHARLSPGADFLSAPAGPAASRDWVQTRFVRRASTLALAAPARTYLRELQVERSPR
jgi:hypothetical protein